MIRCVTLAGLVLAALVLCASAQKDEADKDKDKQPKAKLYKPIYEALDKHGLTEKATRDFEFEGVHLTAKSKEAAMKLVKDPVAFAGDFMDATGKLGAQPDDKDLPRPKLTELKIDGDKATGVIIDKVKVKVKVAVKDKDKEEVKDELQERKVPIVFEKIDGGWRIDFPASRKSSPKDKAPKDSDKKDRKDD